MKVAKTRCSDVEAKGRDAALEQWWNKASSSVIMRCHGGEKKARSRSIPCRDNRGSATHGRRRCNGDVESRGRDAGKKKVQRQRWLQRAQRRCDAWEKKVQQQCGALLL
ncbi:hypothetical protein S245_058955 [Arachis hypogaea]